MAADETLAQSTPLPGQPADGEAKPHGHTPGDPFEHINRGVFSFNEALDKVALEPLAKGYRAVTPRFFRSGVENFLHNLRSPVIFANDVLEVAPVRAGKTAGRFVVNSTVGVLGVFDVARHIGMESHDSDFGLTLGKWGAGGGPYLMLPFLGPSNVRDAVGELVDIAMDPITYAQFENASAAKGLRFAMDELSKRTDAIDAIDAMRQTSIDPYASTRSFYDQSRESAIAGDQDPAEDSPDSNGTLSHGR
jgi:phospholipid-binding lipoprotein MlaA